MTAGCGIDEAALRERQGQLVAAGFDDVTGLESRYASDVDVDHVVGHLYSALDTDVLPRTADQSSRTGCADRSAASRGEQLREDVPVTALVGRR